MSENLKLWNAVQATDPKYTKGFSRSGGFKGTAINATYQIRRATEQWGPIGGKWGCSIVSSDFIPGADGDVVHVALIDFWHPDGKFQTFGQTTFVGKNKNGKFTDEEAPKKSLTDAITKALSMLGFSADVHLGLFDDNKYVNDMKEQFSEEPKGRKPNPATFRAWNALTDEHKLALINYRDGATLALSAKDPVKAAKILFEDMVPPEGLGRQEAGTAIWSCFDSTERSAMEAARKELQPAANEERQAA